MFRLLVIAAPLLFIWLWLWKRRVRVDQERGQLIMRFLSQRGGQSTYAQLASHFSEAPWMARVLSSLRQHGQLAIEIPDQFDRARPREEQIRYRSLSKKLPKAF